MRRKSSILLWLAPLLAVVLLILLKSDQDGRPSSVARQVRGSPAVFPGSNHLSVAVLPASVPVFVNGKVEAVPGEWRQEPETVPGSAVKPERSTHARDQIPGEYICSFFNASDRDAFIAMAESRGVEILDVMDVGNAVRIRVRERNVYEELIKDGPVPADRSCNYYAYLPDDPEEIFEAPAAGYIGFGNKVLEWLGITVDNSTWGQGVTVAVLDSGVADNSLLEGVDITRLSLLKDTAGPDNGGSSHGTAVASLIAGKTPLVRGIVPSASILSIQVIPEDGNGDTFTLARGIVEAVDRGARVINISLGTSGDSFILHDAVDYALARQVVLVASTGNEAVNRVLYPAKYDGVVGVSGVDYTDRHLFFANRGPEVDVSAPAIGINVAGPDGKVEKSNGTSYAAALVSGTLAWMLADDRSLSADRAVEIMLNNCNDTEAPGFDESAGSGVVNVERVMNRKETGLYDIAICRPYIQKSDQGSAVQIYIENRGTEDIDKVSMVVNVAGATSYYDFYNVKVGEIESRTFPLDSTKLATSDGVKIECAVSLDGLDDIHPLDNVLRGRILSGEQ